MSWTFASARNTESLGDLTYTAGVVCTSFDHELQLCNLGLSQEAVVDKELSHRQAATLKGLAAELQIHLF